MKVATSVVMVTYLFPPEFGGATVQALRLASELTRQGFDVSFLADNGASGDAEDTYQSFAVHRRHCVSANQKSLFRQFWFAFRIIGFALRNRRHKIFHFHSVRGPELICMPILRMLGRKTLLKLTLANSDDPLTLSRRRFGGKTYARCLAAVDRIIAISPQLHAMSKAAGVTQEQLVLLPNGVETKTFYSPTQDQRAMLRQKLGIEPGADVLLSVGSVEQRKGFDSLLEAFRLIRDKRPNARLLIVGPGNTPDNEVFVQLTTYIEHNKIQGINFLGSRNDVPDLMMAADIFAFCSRQEGMPNVVAEALCCGLSVVAMRLEGITEWLLGNRPTSVEVLDRDTSDFARKCLDMLEVRSDSVSKTGARDAASEFGMTTIAEQYQLLYSNLLPQL